MAAQNGEVNVSEGVHTFNNAFAHTLALNRKKCIKK